MHNRKYFKQDVSKNKNIILIENFNWYASFIAYSYFSNILSKKYKAKIYSYDPKVLTLPEKIKKLIKPKVLIMRFLYKSFNVSKNISPKISINQKKTSNKLFKKIYFKIKNKEDILKIKILDIHVGDLIYDEYLRYYLEPTINYKDKKFQSHLNNMICLFLFWHNYLKENNIKSIIISHSVYALAIISRIAIYKNIKVFNIGLSYAYLLSKKNKLRLSNFDKFPVDFKKISKLLKKKKDLLSLGKKELFKKLYGAKETAFAISNNATFTSFKKIKIKKSKKNKSKEKILVASHCLTDAVHAYGNFIFPDFYSWLVFLGDLSKELDYEWLIKIHPHQYDLNLREMKKFIQKYPKFKLINKESSHNEILNTYKILGVLTVYGSIGHEYPIFGIPVINSGIINPHTGYNFNVNAKSKKELKEIIINIKKIKKPNILKLKNEIYEFYYMRFLSDYYCIDMRIVQSFYSLGPDYNSGLLYKEWIKKFDINNHNKILKDFEKFIDSGKFRMQADNTSNTSNSSKYLAI